MKVLVDFKLVVLLILCSLLHNASTNHYDRYEQWDEDKIYQNQESQSQENNSDMDLRQKHHHNMQLNQNYDKINTNDRLKQSIPQIQIMQMPNIPQMPLSMTQLQPPRPNMPMMPISMSQPQQPSPNMPQIQIPMPQPPSPNMPQMSMQMSQMQMPQMQMPQMSMPQMPMSQMPMSQMTIPQMPMSPISMQMPALPVSMQIPGQFPTPFSGSFSNQNLLFNPYSSYFTNFLKNMMPPQLKEPLSVATSSSMINEAPTSTEVSTTTKAPTTTPTTTIATTTTTTTTPPPPPSPPSTTTTERQTNNYRQNLDPYIKSQRVDKGMLESVLKNALSDYSNIILKMPEQTKSANNIRVMTSLRRTKPTWVPKFGIVPIPDNMAQRLMSEMRGVKGIRRSRPRRVATFEFE